MAKCEKCSAEYPEGTEHVCPSGEDQKATSSAEDKTAPVE